MNRIVIGLVSLVISATTAAQQPADAGHTVVRRVERVDHAPEKAPGLESEDVECPSVKWGAAAAGAARSHA